MRENLTLWVAKSLSLLFFIMPSYFSLAPRQP